MTDTRKFLRQCVNCKEYKNTLPEKEKYSKINLVRKIERRSLYERIQKSFRGGNIQFNNNNQINGRSVYLCKNSECIKEALKKKKIEHSLKSQIPENMKEELYNLLKN